MAISDPGTSAHESKLVSPEHAEILRHMLGIKDKFDEVNPKPYRDYYCADPANPTLLAMERLGLVERYGARDTQYHWYRTTEAGRTAAFESHRAGLWPKSKRIYRRFLDVADVCPDLTFKEFLTHPRFAETRQSA